MQDKVTCPIVTWGQGEESKQIYWKQKPYKYWQCLELLNMKKNDCSDIIQVSLGVGEGNGLWDECQTS